MLSPAADTVLTADTVHILSSLCVIYPRERSVSIKTQKRFFLVFLLSVKAPLEADPNEFLI